MHQVKSTNASSLSAIFSNHAFTDLHNAHVNKLCDSPSDLGNVHTTYEATKIRPEWRAARVSRMRCSLFSSAIILLLTHKWPQYFLPTQPTNQYKSLTALFQIPTTSAFIHFHLLQKLSLLKSSTLALQFSPPSPPPHLPASPNASDQPPGWVELPLPVKGSTLAAKTPILTNCRFPGKHRDTQG